MIIPGPREILALEAASREWDLHIKHARKEKARIDNLLGVAARIRSVVSEYEAVQQNNPSLPAVPVPPPVEIPALTQTQTRRRRGPRQETPKT